MDALKDYWLLILAVLFLLCALGYTFYKLIDYIWYEIQLKKRRQGKNNLEIRSNIPTSKRRKGFF
ncbi:hypothetical protein [Adhaeribacter aquaticus]|uniref:hypothetical protein n=1 Tax=Adhaeribacter aquaticus TaxID=299567 RepID=UPI0003FCD268|nr:hypothetical protein [Adhaeribacter aquaticus]